MSGKNFDHFSDEDLIVALRIQPDAAFTAIYNRYWKTLLAMAYAALRDQVKAEEIVQDVFLKLWERRESVTIQQLSAYLAASVKFTLYNQISRTKKQKQQLTSNYFPEVSYDGDAALEALFLEKYLDGLVEKLPNQCRLVFTYSRKEGLKIHDIAQKMQISTKTAENHLGRALKILRVALRNISTFLSISFFLLSHWG